MKCRLCGCEEIRIAYQGRIRDGRVGNYYKDDVRMYQCARCGTIWHEDLKEDYEAFYGSEDYRQSLEGTSEIEDFYRMHDGESLEKLRYTGTEVFRNKVTADIGCGGGAFLDYVNTVAKRVIAVEPSRAYRRAMEEKGFTAFPYTEDALKEYRGKVDVVVSFDVIEHVQDPLKFVAEIFQLLSDGGRAFIGTPTGAPVMRELLGADYESFLFSTQHPWVLGAEQERFIVRPQKLPHDRRAGRGSNKGPPSVGQKLKNLRHKFQRVLNMLNHIEGNHNVHFPPILL